MLDFFALALGLALPWAFGIALLASLYRFVHADGADPPPASWLVGCGWFVGMFLLTLAMRGLSAAGIRLGIASVGVPLLVVTTLALIVALRRSPAGLANIAREYLRVLGGQGLEGWQRTLWRLLVAWLVVRFALLLAEVWWRPLYPWDAWTQWGTKARVWFELGRLVPFVDVSEWLSGNPPNAYFDSGPHYPATVPLFQVWAAIVIGRWDDALVEPALVDHRRGIRCRVQRWLEAARFPATRCIGWHGDADVAADPERSRGARRLCRSADGGVYHARHAGSAAFREHKKRRRRRVGGAAARGVRHGEESGQGVAGRALAGSRRGRAAPARAGARGSCVCGRCARQSSYWHVPA